MTKGQAPRPEGEEMDFRIPSRRALEQGEVIQGTVVMVGSTHLFLDVGAKSEAILDIKEVADENGRVAVKVGDQLQAYVVSTEPELVLSYAMARSHLSLQAIEDAFDLGIPVEGKVTAVNKGGLEVDLNGARAFCPVSQIERGFCEDPSAFVGLALQFKITEYSEGGRNIVVSRRALLEEQRREAAEETQARLFEGAELEGEVVTLQPYGAFVDLGGVQGMVHISEIGHGHIEHPSEALSLGQRVRVRVLRVEPDPKHPDRQRIALSARALLGDPWEETAAGLAEGVTVEGRVVRLQPFGAFVEIAPGVDGLIHISELADHRVSHPSEVVEVGQVVQATVLKVDLPGHRISLSLLGGADLADSEALAVGSVVDVVVNRVKPFGLLVSIKGHGRGVRGLVPAEETGTGSSANLRRAFPEGSELRAAVIARDAESGRLRLSFRAVAEMEERETFTSFSEQTARSAPAARGKARESLGTLGDVLRRAMDPKRDGENDPT